MKKDPNKYPPGLNLKKVRAIIEHYDNQTEEEAIAEMEEGLAVMAGNTVVHIDTAISRKIIDLAREKKTSLDKLINSLLKKNLPKAA